MPSFMDILLAIARAICGEPPQPELPTASEKPSFPVPERPPFHVPEKRLPRVPPPPALPKRRLQSEAEKPSESPAFPESLDHRKQKRPERHATFETPQSPPQQGWYPPRVDVESVGPWGRDSSIPAVIPKSPEPVAYVKPSFAPLEPRVHTGYPPTATGLGPTPADRTQQLSRPRDEPRRQLDQALPSLTPTVVHEPAVSGPKPSPAVHEQQPGRVQVERRNRQAYQEDEHFTTLRDKAKQEGDLMGQCYADSRDAYDQKNHALAKELSEQAKKHKHQMEVLNKEASDWIFRALNSGIDPGMVDLHGLYVEEARSHAETAIVEAKERGDASIRFIVGKGLHSDGHRARIKPALEEYVNNCNLDAEVDPDNAGVLIVHLS